MNDLDHRLVGALVEHEQELRYPTLTAFADELGKSRQLLYRLMKGDPTITPRTLRRIEMLLDLPERSLELVRQHRFNELKETDMRAEALKWVLQQAGEPIPAAADSRRRGRRSS